MLFLLLVMYLIDDNADLLLSRFFRDTLDIADVLYLIFFCENGRSVLRYVVDIWEGEVKLYTF